MDFLDSVRQAGRPVWRQTSTFVDNVRYHLRGSQVKAFRDSPASVTPKVPKNKKFLKNATKTDHRLGENVTDGKSLHSAFLKSSYDSIMKDQDSR